MNAICWQIFYIVDREGNIDIHTHTHTPKKPFRAVAFESSFDRPEVKEYTNSLGKRKIRNNIMIKSSGTQNV